MNFWITIAIITLVICLIGFYPLLKKSVRTNNTKRDNLNKAFYFDRLKEVEREVSEGVIDDPEQTKQELQQSLLDDIPAQTPSMQADGKSYGKIWFLTLLITVGSISLITYFKVGSWQANSMVNATHNKLDYFYERMKNEEKEPFNEQELNQFAIALRADLQKTPDDAKKWFTLGQIGLAKDDGNLAYESFEKASKLDPNNIQYKSSFAQILIFSQDKSDKEKGKALLKEIIRIDHTNFDALSLLAFSSFEEEDYKMAAMTWGMMLKLMPENEPRRAMIERSMNHALEMQKAQEQNNKAADKPSAPKTEEKK